MHGGGTCGDSTVFKRWCETVKNLLCVKSILTLTLSTAFAALCFIYPDDYEETMKTVIVAVITFYFSHQIEKGGQNK